MIIARQSTVRTITVGPVLDADGVAVTDCVVADFTISKNGGAPAALNGSATLTHRAVGFYSLALTASDLDTVGQAEIVISDTVNACSMKEITVVEEAVYDALFAASATGMLPANVIQLLGTAWLTPGTAGTPDVNVRLISGDSVAADNLEAAADGTGYNLGGGSVVAASVTGAVGSVAGNVDGSVGSVAGNVGGNVVGSVASVSGNVGGNVTGSVGSVASGGISSGSFAAGAINAAAIATDAIGSDEISAAAVTKIQNGLATPTNITAGTITTVTNLTNLPSIPAGWITAAGIATGAIDADALATDAVTEIVAGVMAGGDADGLSLENALKILLASAAGKLSGAATTTIEIRAVDDSKVRITSTVDSDGQRTAVTLDATG